LEGIIDETDEKPKAKSALIPGFFELEYTLPPREFFGFLRILIISLVTPGFNFERSART
jgi:hypothetical protein